MPRNASASPPETPAPPRYSSIELFAGAGGLAQGVTRAGFHPRMVAEWNKDACETIRENQRRGSGPVQDWRLTESDVRTLSFGVFAGVDLISGGPPCQPFSLGGKHAGPADSRDMFPQAIRAVREARPRAFLFENVRGLTRATFKPYFDYVLMQMRWPDLEARPGEEWTSHLARLTQHDSSAPQDAGYHVTTALLQAADFGVPQKRERVFFVGFRNDVQVEWCFPEPTHSADQLLIDQYVTGSYWERHGLPRPTPSAQIARRVKAAQARQVDTAKSAAAWQTVRDALGDLPDPEHVPDNGIPGHRFIPGARRYPGHTGSLPDEPGKTIKAGAHGVPGGENMLVRPDGTVRYLTVREAARLQTFSDDYVFSGSWGTVMRQLGNAVPVTLATAVARSVAAALPLR